MGKIVRVTTDGNVEQFDYPAGSYDRVHSKLCALIGGKCDMYELVRPRRLYEVWECGDYRRSYGGVVMIVDEEGLQRRKEPNKVGSYLYMTDKHGSPIVGNILFVGEEFTPEGPDMCGMDDETADYIESKVRELLGYED